MALPKWTDERTDTLTEFVGEESPVSQSTVIEAADELETSPRSVASKLRKMGYEVESAVAATTRTFSENQEATLQTFVTDNAGQYTYGEIAEAFEGGAFSPKQIQGKLLSMQLTEHVRPTPKQESVKTFSDAEEATFIKMAGSNSYLEDIADALGKQINQIRGKALSLLRSGSIDSIPAQRDTKGPSRVDPLEGVDVSSMSVADIAEQIGKTVRGVKTMLTRRGLAAVDYDGAAKREKAAG